MKNHQEEKIYRNESPSFVPGFVFFYNRLASLRPIYDAYVGVKTTWGPTDDRWPFKSLRGRLFEEELHGLKIINLLPPLAAC